LKRQSLIPGFQFGIQEFPFLIIPELSISGIFRQ